jgi:hypothetical protein
MEVEARYKGKARYYPGSIKRDNGDGTFDIDYADGEKEAGVAGDLIRPLAPSGISSIGSSNLLGSSGAISAAVEQTSETAAVFESLRAELASAKARVAELESRCVFLSAHSGGRR